MCVCVVSGDEADGPTDASQAAAGKIDEKADGVVIIDSGGTILMVNKVRVCVGVCRVRAQGLGG
jgi:hypothetical protein